MISVGSFFIACSFLSWFIWLRNAIEIRPLFYNAQVSPERRPRQRRPEITAWIWRRHRPAVKAKKKAATRARAALLSDQPVAAGREPPLHKKSREAAEAKKQPTGEGGLEKKVVTIKKSSVVHDRALWTANKQYVKTDPGLSAPQKAVLDVVKKHILPPILPGS